MKLLVCDVEGTIFKANYRIEGTEYASTMWQPLAASLGEGAILAEKDTHVKWESGLYDTYSTWVEATIKIHKQYGLHKDTFYGLIREAEYQDGVKDFFAQLDRKKYIPVLISGGFQELTNRALKELNINHGFGACEYFFDDKDGILSGHSLKPCDFDGKYHYVENLFKDYNLTNKDWVFIGDGKNDIPIAKKAPLSIGMKPIHPDLEKVVDHVVADFKEIFGHLKAEEEIIPLTNIYNPPLAPKPAQRCISATEDQLKKDNESLRDKVKSLTREAKEARDSLYMTQKVNHNEILVNSNDYTDVPNINFSELLDEYKVVFSGLHSDSRIFIYLANYHKNLAIITGSKKSFNTTPMENAHFIFTFKGCMGHPNSWKSEGARSKVPWANLSNHRNKDMLENAMANVLIKYFQVGNLG
jgi:phosphoserine phosphatase